MNDLLPRLVGERMYAVEFVLNDYLQLRFDGPPSAGPITMNCYVWPVVECAGRTWREPDLGYADVLRRLTPGIVAAADERTADGIRIELDTGSVLIRPAADEIYVEIAEIMGFPDRSWKVWRPGEESFEYL